MFDLEFYKYYFAIFIMQSQNEHSYDLPIIVYIYFQDTCNFFLFFAQSDKYRLISVWYGMPDSSLCALKKSTVSLSIFIVICFFSLFTYGFLLGFKFSISYSSLIDFTSCISVICFCFTFGCFPC